MTRPAMSEDELRAMLVAWVRARGGAACAELGARVVMDEPRAMKRVLAALVDGVIRRILPLEGRYGGGIGGLAELPSIAEPATLTLAWERVRGMQARSPSALSSAAMALSYLQRLPESPSAVQIEEAWTSILYPSGCLHMAMYRHAEKNAVDPDEVSRLLEEAIRPFTA